MRHAVRVRGLRVEVEHSTLPIIDEIDLDIPAGKIVGLVGESGSGKTTLGLALLGYAKRGLRIARGRVLLGDIDLLSQNAHGTRSLRRSAVAYVPQSPESALNPALRIGTQIREGLAAFGKPLEERVREMLTEVGLPADDKFIRLYPHQLSGGQQQRVVVAMAFIARPRLVVLDEPTTGLDASTEARVLEAIRRMCVGQSAAALYISHDTAVVAALADQIAVMRSGRIVGTGPTAELLAGLRDPRAQRRPASFAAASSPVMQTVSLRAGYGKRQVLHGVDLQLLRGQCTALLGESGSGKTTLARSAIGLHPFTGELLLHGVHVRRAVRKRTVQQCRSLQYIFQDPYTSLNPRRTIGSSILRPRLVLGGDQANLEQVLAEALQRVALHPDMANRYPEQLSGGQCQRAAIARALVARPEVLICDEITSALDVSTQSSIIDLLIGLQESMSLSLLFITHNISLARTIAQSIAILDAGRIVEHGPTEELLGAPQHPHTRLLLESWRVSDVFEDLGFTPRAT